MARFTPIDWVCSENAKRLYREHRTEVDKIIRSEVRGYFNLPATDACDLSQEGLIAALYALDSYAKERGSMGGYIRCVVRNALAMVACEVTAQCRQAQTYIKDEDTKGYEPCEVGQETPGAPVGYREVVIPGVWRRVAVSEAAEPDTVQTQSMSPERGVAAAEDAMDAIRKTAKARARVAELRARLSPAAQLILDLRVDPPIELLVTARNIIGRNVSEEAKMPTAALAQYARMTVAEVQRALKEIRNTFTALRGMRAAEAQS